jgi:hypothetical protein
MTIKYYKDLDYLEEVTFEEANKLQEYTGIFSNGDDVKKREHYDKGVLRFTEYYRSSDETEQSIIETLSASGSAYYIIEKTISKNYYTENIKGYKAKSLSSLSRRLYNNMGSIICEENYDIISVLPLYEDTKKHFYDYSLEDYFPITTAYYLPNGDLKYIEYGSFIDPMGQDTYRFTEKGDGVDVEDIASLADMLGLTLEQISYYLTAELMPSVDLNFIDGSIVFKG